jgi:ribosomal protein L37AE/L43A
MSATDGSGQRAVPYHCPYCGETDLFPAEKGWECRACLRAFTVTMLGMVRPNRPVTGGA